MTRALTPLNFHPSLTRRGSRRGGHARAAHFDHVIEGRRYSTREIAQRLGVCMSTALERTKKAPHPLTWDGLEGERK